MNRDRLSVFDYVFILRPMLFFPGWSTLLAGYVIRSNDYWVYFKVFDSSLWLLLCSFALLMGSSFILNQLNDVESDRTNRKLFLISDGMISPRAARNEAVVLALIALTIGFWLEIIIGLLYVVFFLVTAIFYNYPPALLKDRPWGSLIANSVMGFLAFCVGWFAVQAADIQIFIDVLPYLLFNTALYLHTTLPDIEGDRQVQKKTLAVIYGPAAIMLTAFFLYLCGFLLTWLLNDHLAFIFYSASLPFFIYTIVSRRISAAVLTTKFAILFFAFAICLRWPPYFILMSGGFLITKFYYKLRFNFNYPQFSG